MFPYSLGVCDTDRPFQDRSRLLRIPEQTTEPARAGITPRAESKSAESRERVAGESAKSQHSPRRLVPSVFWNRQCSFETVPMEAGPKPSQLKLLQAQCSRAGRERQSWDLQKQFAASLLSLSSTRLRFQRSDSCSLFFYYLVRCERTRQENVRKWPGKTARGEKGFKVYVKWRVCDVTQEAVLDIAWGKILMSVCGTDT